MRHERGRAARGRATLDALQEMLDASRRSSGAVLTALDAALRAADESIDSVLAFVPAGAELACAYAGGSRAEPFRRYALRRDHTRALVAIAAAGGSRARFPDCGEALIPTDRRALAMPMREGSRLHAVVYVSSTGAQPLEEDALVETIERAAAPFAIALEREADRADATHDGLTGLLAPRAFRRLLHEEFGRARLREGEMLSLWFVDTDRFKSINDGFGHKAGDAVLQAMAALLREHLIAELDVAARNGGDEFCALVRATGKNASIERARGFCAAVARHDFGLGVPVTASVGVAAFPHDAATSSALLEIADAAMYHSKRNGRGCVSFAVGAATFAVAEAPSEPSRSFERWRSNAGASCAQSRS